ncbi:hypothetical protein L211DRAFT_893612 [Terfezia boudieri ATCC MYA-4762]|uniref:Uncharacterized protein n=1 Tax=Terfezia boudieri ATCC MYA-4762 TaxID=1051890 RepID=A0A3N4LQP2_9PEZI|nr:hypothetical protein L211DRAFT_893612 [Terfezia boudieri ATCC MYA-4762]
MSSYQKAGHSNPFRAPQLFQNTDFNVKYLVISITRVIFSIPRLNLFIYHPNRAGSQARKCCTSVACCTVYIPNGRHIDIPFILLHCIKGALHRPSLLPYQTLLTMAQPDYPWPVCPEITTHNVDIGSLVDRTAVTPLVHLLSQWQLPVPVCDFPLLYRCPSTSVFISTSYSCSKCRLMLAPKKYGIEIPAAVKAMCVTVRQTTSYSKGRCKIISAPLSSSMPTVLIKAPLSSSRVTAALSPFLIASKLSFAIRGPWKQYVSSDQVSGQDLVRELRMLMLTPKLQIALATSGIGKSTDQMRAELVTAINLSPWSGGDHGSLAAATEGKIMLVPTFIYICGVCECGEIVMCCSYVDWYYKCMNDWPIVWELQQQDKHGIG